MKKLIMICVTLVIALRVSAQSGTVIYNETMKLEIHLDGEAAGMQDLLPKERKTTKQLHYTPEATIYLSAKQEPAQVEAEEMAGGGTMMIKMQEPQSQVYTDLLNQKVIEQREFLSRMFLIESKADSLPWKLTGNRREILGFPCMEAVYTKDSSKTIAWFTPSIRVSAGPGKYIGLPGLILEINFDNGKRIISASSVTKADVAELIVKPKEGKKVSRKEFDKIVEEKTGETNGHNGGTIMIKISR